MKTLAAIAIVLALAGCRERHLSGGETPPAGPCTVGDLYFQGPPDAVGHTWQCEPAWKYIGEDPQPGAPIIQQSRNGNCSNIAAVNGNVTVNCAGKEQ